MTYDLEKFADVLEAMADAPMIVDFPQGNPKEMEHFYNMAVADWHRRRGFKHAADMLRKSPMALWVNYPDYFPEPKEDNNG